MKKFVLLLLIATRHSWPTPTTRNCRRNCAAISSTQQVQVIVQYAPGTQVNCSGLLGLVDCLVNDILKLGGTILDATAAGQRRRRVCSMVQAF